MKETRIDLRTEKTFSALNNAFQELIQEKPFEQITVTELCQRARTRTATFYNHFSDKYDYFSYFIRELRKEHLTTAEVKGAAAHPEDYYIQLLRSGFDFIEQHAKMVENVESDTLLTTIMQTISDDITRSLKEHLALVAPFCNGITPDVMTQIFIGAMTQCSRWWFENRKTVSKEEVLAQLSEAIKRLFPADQSEP